MHLPSTLENALRKEVEEEYVNPKSKNKSRGCWGAVGLSGTTKYLGNSLIKQIFKLMVKGNSVGL